MASAFRTTTSRLFLAGAVLFATVAPAVASIDQPAPIVPPISATEKVVEQHKPANVDWLEPHAQSSLHQEAGADSYTAALATPTGFVAVTARDNTIRSNLQREDKDLSADESAVRRYNLPSEEPLFSENWWQAVPGIVVACVVGLVMYMRSPLQRKRKYRRTPHEPYGPYRRRG